jgi:hypothetical protein
MLCHRASTNHPEDDIIVQGYMEHLRQALRLVLESLDNYSTAFEALDGMRGLFDLRNVLAIANLITLVQIQESLDSDIFL